MEFSPPENQIGEYSSYKDRFPLLCGLMHARSGVVALLTAQSLRPVPYHVLDVVCPRTQLLPCMMAIGGSWHSRSADDSILSFFPGEESTDIVAGGSQLELPDVMEASEMEGDERVQEGESVGVEVEGLPKQDASPCNEGDDVPEGGDDAKSETGLNAPTLVMGESPKEATPSPRPKRRRVATPLGRCAEALRAQRLQAKPKSTPSPKAASSSGSAKKASPKPKGKSMPKAKASGKAKSMPKASGKAKSMPKAKGKAKALPKAKAKGSPKSRTTDEVLKKMHSVTGLNLVGLGIGMSQP